MQTLQQLQSEQLELEQRLAENKEKQIAIFDAAFCKKNGFGVGDIVLFEGNKAKIVGFDRGSDGVPFFYKISFFKKDRSLGTAQRIVYNHEQIKKA